ncbi:MAG TPA: M48 family metallopeptidase, partial [Planctomycetota bacterium]|nr:M48 family metallopeptidase [Planctomycetota bacterium]
MASSKERAGSELDRLPPEASAVLAGLEGRIARPRVRPLYRVGLALAAFAMIALPLLYVGLIAAVCVGIWLAAGAMESWAQPTAGIVIVSVLGGLVVLFLVKPLLARPGRAGARAPLALRRDRQPLLFAFVDRLCAVVGFPSPSRIDIDTEPNASASPRRGLVSLLRKDLVLTIGMPLAGALDLRAFAGVLAHELGHFAQGAGMRLTYVVRSINFWFARV